MYITILVTLSRPTEVHRTLANLVKALTPEYLYELVIGIDNRAIRGDAVEEEVRSLPFHFKNIEIIETFNPVPPDKDMIVRRNRITELHSLMQQAVGASMFIFGIEDDSELPEGALNTLLATYKRLSDHQQEVGIVQGTQVGRWGHEYLGAWDVDNLQNPTKFTSIKYDNEAYVQVSGGGMFCFLTMTKLYKEHEFKWMEPLGPDFWFGLSLARKGYNNFVDMSVVCGHRTENKILQPTEESPQIILEQKGMRFKTTIQQNKN